MWHHNALASHADAFQVHVSPSFVHLSEEDSQVTLNCSYDSEFNQMVDIHWLRVGQENSALSDRNLLTLPRDEAVGSYVCVVTSSLDVQRIARATGVCVCVCMCVFVHV